MPLSRERECLLAVQVIDALVELESVGFEIILRVDVDASQRIHQIDQRVKVDPDIIRDLDAVELLQRPHGCLHAVDSGVGQFVPHISGDLRDVDIVVTGCRSQKDLVSQRIHRHQNIDVASACRGDRSVHVDSADQHRVGVIGHIPALALRPLCRSAPGFNLGLEPFFKDHTGVVCIVRDRVAQKTCVSYIADHGVHFAVQKSLGELQRRVVFLRIDRVVSVGSLYLLDHIAHHLLRGPGIDAEFISRRVLDRLRGIVFGHDDSHALDLRVRACDPVQCIHDVLHIYHGKNEHSAHKNGQNTAQRPCGAALAASKEHRDRHEKDHCGDRDPKILSGKQAAPQHHKEKHQ